MSEPGSIPDNPYVGPRPFTQTDPLFGRDVEKVELLNLLIAERIVLLYSPSGAGKTSLIQAGLVPELKAGAVPAAAYHPSQPHAGRLHLPQPLRRQHDRRAGNWAGQCGQETHH